MTKSKNRKKKTPKVELKIPPPPSGLSRVKNPGSHRGIGTFVTRCPCGKLLFRTYDGAMSAAHRSIPTNVKRVYYCPEGGGYHFTGSPFMSRKQRLDELRLVEEDDKESQ